MNGNGKVSVPPHKAPDAGGNEAITKTGRTVKGFGGGSMPGSLEGNDTVSKAGNGKGAVRGFSGGGMIGGKV
jgi:hypothetical protein